MAPYLNFGLEKGKLIAQKRIKYNNALLQMVFEIRLQRLTRDVILSYPIDPEYI
jgi:hypothetical protein